MEIVLWHGGNVHIGRQEAAQTPVVILNSSFLPRLLWIAKITMYAVVSLEQGIAPEFKPTVERHGLTAGLRQGFQAFADEGQNST